MQTEILADLLVEVMDNPVGGKDCLSEVSVSTSKILRGKSRRFKFSLQDKSSLQLFPGLDQQMVVLGHQVIEATQLVHGQSRPPRWTRSPSCLRLLIDRFAPVSPQGDAIKRALNSIRSGLGMCEAWHRRYLKAGLDCVFYGPEFCAGHRSDHGGAAAIFSARAAS
jgi:hypothetical protein